MSTFCHLCKHCTSDRPTKYVAASKMRARASVHLKVSSAAVNPVPELCGWLLCHSPGRTLLHVKKQTMLHLYSILPTPEQRQPAHTYSYTFNDHIQFNAHQSSSSFCHHEGPLPFSVFHPPASHETSVRPALCVSHLPLMRCRTWAVQLPLLLRLAGAPEGLQKNKPMAFSDLLSLAANVL